jgi:hypothetical protein
VNVLFRQPEQVAGRFGSLSVDADRDIAHLQFAKGTTAWMHLGYPSFTIPPNHHLAYMQDQAIYSDIRIIPLLDDGILPHSLPTISTSS